MSVERKHWRIADFIETNPTVSAVAGRLLNANGSPISSCRRFGTPLDYFFEYIGLSEILPGLRRAGRFRMLDWDYNERRVVDAASGAFLLHA